MTLGVKSGDDLSVFGFYSRRNLWQTKITRTGRRPVHEKPLSEFWNGPGPHEGASTGTTPWSNRISTLLVERWRGLSDSFIQGIAQFSPRREATG
jgi:hypothetical protein